MLKCLTSVADGATIKCRYSDIKFAAKMPKVLTCNCTNIDQWLSLVSEHAEAEDLHAVMRRCLFVEVGASLIPASLRRRYAEVRETELADLQAQALRAQGIDVQPCSFFPVQRTNGVWARASQRDLDEAAAWARVAARSTF